MKKLFTIFILSVLFASTTFATKNCVFIVAANATADQNIIDYLNANGYVVTVFVGNGTVPAGYDLAVLSETINSTANTWKAFKNAPLPFVALKTFAAKANANSLSWLSTNVTGTDFANTTDITVTVPTAASSHSIVNGISATTQLLYQTVVDAVTPTNIAALQWINFPTLPSGATVLTTVTIGNGTTYTIAGQIPQTIAFEQNTTLNTAKLINRAVMSGFNNLANAQLTTDAFKLIKQSCDWVSELGVFTSIQNTVATNQLKKLGDELVNPTNLKVEVYNTLGARVHISKESYINLGNLNKGVYVAKTNAGVLKFAL